MPNESKQGENLKSNTLIEEENSQATDKNTDTDGTGTTGVSDDSGSIGTTTKGNGNQPGGRVLTHPVSSSKVNNSSSDY